MLWIRDVKRNGGTRNSPKKGKKEKEKDQVNIETKQSTYKSAGPQYLHKSEIEMPQIAPTSKQEIKPDLSKSGETTSFVSHKTEEKTNFQSIMVLRSF